MTQIAIEYFDEKKAGQLMYFFLSKAASSNVHITKSHLFTWLYLAERASYEEFGLPLVKDRLCSMRHGPAPSELVSIIEGKSKRFNVQKFGTVFEITKYNGQQYIQIAKNCDYSSIADLDRFSDAEIELLDSVWAKYGNWSFDKLQSHLHDRNFFPEWNWKKGDSTNWIDIEELLAIVGFDEQSVNAMVDNIMSFGLMGHSS